MNRSKITGSLISILALARMACPATFSGTLINLDNTPRPGVLVSLSSTGQSSLTDSVGNWSIQTLSATAERGVDLQRQLSRHLLFDGGRLKLSLGSWTPLGKRVDATSDPFARQDLVNRIGAEKRAGRLASPGYGVDTLNYTFHQSIIMRDTVWNAGRTQILRIFDTTLDPFFLSYGLDCLDSSHSPNVAHLCWQVVTIGKQTWMVRNIGQEYNGNQYTWAAAMGYPDTCNFSRDCGVPDSCKSPASCNLSRNFPHVQGICPTSDYRIPTDSDWVELIDTVQHNLRVGLHMEAVALKARFGWAGGPDWMVLGPSRTHVPWTVGTNLFGFTARPLFDSTEFPQNTSARWWTSSQYPAGDQCRIAEMTSATYMGTKSDQKTKRYSVRCLRDAR